VTTPASKRGFELPPEWAPQARTWMAWPSGRTPWGEHLAAARRVHAEVAKAIAEFQPVTMIARPDLTADASLHCGQGVSVLPLPHDDSWTRDTAPSFLLNAKGELACVDWHYDGYGADASDVRHDTRLAEAICNHLEIEHFAVPIVLEDGALHVDGEGTCLMCAGSVLDPTRNPGLDRAGAEAVLASHLGAVCVIWLEAGLINDPTGGHVDNLACFAAPGTVLALAPGRDEVNAPILEANVARLKASVDAKGRTLEVIEIPCPEPAFTDDGRQLPRSYVSFAIVNGAVIMPVFGEVGDRAAFRAISAAFADREVVRIEAQDLIQGGGTIHSITRQQPKAP
jgi:agmatine deiminase